MPIKGLTDRENGLGDGLIRIATLFKGEEQREYVNKQGKTVMIVGNDLKHFRVEFEPEYEWARETWEELYGKEPEQFEPVYLAAQSVEEILESWWMEDWNGSGTLLHRCDGEMQVKHWQAGAGMYSSARILCAGEACKCKETARLTLILPRLWDALGIPCVVTLTTHSKYDILALRGHLALIQKMCGTLAGVPFVFGRAPRQISVPSEKEPGKRIKTTKSLLYIRVTSDFTRNHLLPMLSAAPAAALPAGDDLDELDEIDARAALGAGENRRLIVPDDELEDEQLDTQTFQCHALFIIPNKGGYQYIAKCGDTNIVSDSAGVYREADFIVDEWLKDVPRNGKTIPFNPPWLIVAKPDSKGGWIPLEIKALSDIPF